MDFFIKRSNLSAEKNLKRGLLQIGPRSITKSTLFMFENQMWLLYAVGAAMLWGASYAASGPVLRAGMPPLVFYFYFSLFGMVAAISMIFLSGKAGLLLVPLHHERSQTGWFLFSLMAAAVGAVMTYMAIGAKNATLACLIEISYPLFVVFFAWLFFREFQLNIKTFIGAILVVSGILTIFLGEK